MASCILCSSSGWSPFGRSLFMVTVIHDINSWCYLESLWRRETSFATSAVWSQVQSGESKTHRESQSWSWCFLDLLHNTQVTWKCQVDLSSDQQSTFWAPMLLKPFSCPNVSVRIECSDPLLNVSETALSVNLLSFIKSLWPASICFCYNGLLGEFWPWLILSTGSASHKFNCKLFLKYHM